MSTRDRLAAMVELRDSGPGRPVQTLDFGDGSPDVPAFSLPPETPGVRVRELGLSPFPAPTSPATITENRTSLSNDPAGTASDTRTALAQRERVLAEVHEPSGRLTRPRTCLGGHLKTGHRSTLQNRPPRGRGDRDSVFGRRPATSWVAAVSLRVLVLLLLLQYKGRLWECGNLAFWARFPSPLWKPFCGFHRDVISIAVFGRRPTGSRPADIHGMLYVAGLPIVVLEPVVRGCL